MWFLSFSIFFLLISLYPLKISLFFTSNAGISPKSRYQAWPASLNDAQSRQLVLIPFRLLPKSLVPHFEPAESTSYLNLCPVSGPCAQTLHFYVLPPLTFVLFCRSLGMPRSLSSLSLYSHSGVLGTNLKRSESARFYTCLLSFLLILLQLISRVRCARKDVHASFSFRHHSMLC